MPSFDPRPTYTVADRPTPIRDFHDYREEFVVRPPYQRKAVWGRKKQQDLIDSLFRRFYIPRIVLREVRLGDEHSINEVIDGQQRITTVQGFFQDKLPIPKSLSDLVPNLVGLRYSELEPKVRRFFDRIQLQVDLVQGIADPRDRVHQNIATEIFWRLQQGESLNYMEVAHSRLSSLARNFVVKYADDQGFDYEAYRPIEGNPHKHSFFKVIDRGNERMQHLALLTRFLLLEEADGPTDLNNGDVEAYIERYQREDGVGSLEMENAPQAKQVLSTMNTFYQAFSDDPLVTDADGMKEFKVEYFIISAFLLLRHLKRHYVCSSNELHLFRCFIQDFYGRWKGAHREEDRDVLAFSDARQQSGTEVEIRDRIMRQLFFEYARRRGQAVVAKDPRREFSEAERIAVYRRQDGLCQMCLMEGLTPKEAFVPWREYQADHVLPHARGGRTTPDNAQVLCRFHNQSKGGQSPADAEK